MGYLGPIVNQLYPGTLIVDLGIALVLFSHLSILYKRNPAYTIMENLAVGTTVAVTIVGAFTMLRTQLAPPLSGGQLIYLVPVLYGLLYFSVFGKGIWRTIFRILLMIGIGRDLSFTLSGNFAWTLQTLLSYARLTDWTRVIMLALLLLGMTYFIFGLWLDRPTRNLRRIGIYAIYSMVTPSLVSVFMGFGYEFIGSMEYIVKSPAVIVPIALAAWIVVDILRRR